jgi:hypothetical protein
MPRAMYRKRVLGLLVLTGLTTVFSGQSARADGEPVVICPPITPQTRRAFRPILPPAQPRPFYISNYAGSVYPPVIPRNDPLAPVTARYNAGRPVGRRFGWLFGGY